MTGLITGIANKAIGALFDEWADGKKARDELDVCVSAAITEARKRNPKLFEKEGDGFDHAFWNDTRVKRALWGTVVATETPELGPDFEQLWEAYKEHAVSGNGLWARGPVLERDEFEHAIDVFWRTFLSKARIAGTKLGEIIAQRVIFLIDETITPAEAREMIRQYAETAVAGMAENGGALAKRTALEHDFWPKTLTGKFTDDEIRREFFDYKRTRTPLTRLRNGESIEYSVSSDGDERVVEDVLQLPKCIIRATGGVGKTRLLRELEVQVLEEIAAGNRRPGMLPIFVKASELKSDEETKLVERLYMILGEYMARKWHDNKRRALAKFVLRHGWLLALVDAYDQIDRSAKQHDTVISLLKKSNLFLGGRFIVTTRPGPGAELAHALDVRKKNPYGVTELELDHFVSYSGVQAFFGEWFDSVRDLPLNEASSNDDKSLVQIPLLARLLKIMVMDGHKTSSMYPSFLQNGKYGVVREFVEYIKETQKTTKDKTTRDEEKDEKYAGMIAWIKKISLALLEGGKILNFKKSLAEELTGNDFHRYWKYAGNTEFMQIIYDCEGERCVEREEQQYLHQIFQEYFAAEELADRYRRGSKERKNARKAFGKIPEATGQFLEDTGRMFTECLVYRARRDGSSLASGLRYWQDVLEARNSTVWERTYAMEIRDILADMDEECGRLLQSWYNKETREIQAQLKKNGDFVTIPAGLFLYGLWETSGEKRVQLEKTDREIEICRNPVTNEEYADFLEEYAKDHDKLKNGDRKKLVDFEWSKIKKDGDRFRVESEYERHPVTGVTWYGARAYCKWRTAGSEFEYFLPEELEWEKAARGGKGRRYPWGHAFDKVRLNSTEGGKGDTTRVGMYGEGASPYGLADAAGNVWEWTSGRHEDKKDTYVLRGGSWGSVSDDCRCANRSRSDPDDRDGDLGFRCARTKK